MFISTQSPVYPPVGMAKDPSLSGPEIIVEISFPELYFALVVDLGEEGLQIGDIKGWSFTYMKLVISKRLIGLELKCKISLGDSSPSIFTGGVSVRMTVCGYYMHQHPCLNWRNCLALGRMK